MSIGEDRRGSLRAENKEETREENGSPKVCDRCDRRSMAPPCQVAAVVERVGGYVTQLWRSSIVDFIRNKNSKACFMGFLTANRYFE